MLPFTKYRVGYLDGYNGDPIRMQKDKMYMFGYEAGQEDDMLGIENKFLDAINI